jgi:exodeoxyribonuclease V alpha subunit
MSEATLARSATGLLADFNRAGILTAADVQVARRLGVLGAETDEAVLLAAALAVRSTRHGSVVIDLATAEETTSPDVDEDGEATTPEVALAWPDRWAQRCAASPLAAGPLHVDGSRVWLTRYWQQEEQVAQELLERSASRPGDLDPELLRAGLDRLFRSGEDDDQRMAAACALLTRVSVLAGGPGTGKTTTVSRLLALLREQRPGCRIALAAPTGKAAARLEETVRSSAAGLPPEDRARVGDLAATTLHRLLGWRPDARSRFRQDRTNRLPYDVVVVDEASMLSLTLMARLLEALRPTTRLLLVGDPDQLASVEAGAVLADLVDPERLGRRTPDLAAALRVAIPGAAVEQVPASPAALVRDGVAALTVSRRFDAVGGIATLAAAVREGDAQRALELLRRGEDGIELVEVPDDGHPSPEQLTGVRADVQRTGAALRDAAEAGDVDGALKALDEHRLLCAHRRGPRGVQHWAAVAARWVDEAPRRGAGAPVELRADGHHAGEPLLVTSNDYDIGLYNGDTGVVVDDRRGGLVAVFGRGGAPVVVPLVRLGAVRPLHAMTVHRSQGSQFTAVTVLLPAAGSALGTRETLYTAVTRATTHVRVVGSAEALVAAVERPAARATGLRDRLGGHRSP